MYDNLPDNYEAALDWEWSDWHPYYQALQNVDLTADNIRDWLATRDKVERLYHEVATRIRIATRTDTTDEQASTRLKKFMGGVFSGVQKITVELNRKLLESGVTPDELKIPLRKIEADIRLFREENLPLMGEQSAIIARYSRIAATQTVEWEGEETTLRKLGAVMWETDREKRQNAWEILQNRVLEDRDAYNNVWRDLITVRKQIYQNGGFNDYREYAWLDRGRFDYTPDDALALADAIAEVVVPANERIMEKERQLMGYETMRPWDVYVDPYGHAPIVPYDNIDNFINQTETIFAGLHPEFGQQFKMMKDEGLLDLENRKGKAPGGFCVPLPMSKRSFIFMNAVGQAGDVRTLIHESGHAFHGFAISKLPYHMMATAPLEFAEVAAMAMELLAYPYLDERKGGYLSTADTARFRREGLRESLSSLVQIAMCMELQHWIYTHHDKATNPDAVDEKWIDLVAKYQPGIDWRGYEQFQTNQWRQLSHVFRAPFYMIEYVLARLGSVQIWANSVKDETKAIEQYRSALAIGGTVSLPELFETAGAKLAFDAETLTAVIKRIEDAVAELDTVL